MGLDAIGPVIVGLVVWGQIFMRLVIMGLVVVRPVICLRVSQMLICDSRFPAAIIISLHFFSSHNLQLSNLTANRVAATITQ